MAVYTPVSDDALHDFVAGFDIGTPVACDPIADGIENSNYLLRTDRGTGADVRAGKFILTLYESRVDADDLPFYLDLMVHLSQNGIDCPLPVPDREGRKLHQLSGKSAALFTFLDGTWPRAPGSDDCRSVGRSLAAFHAAGASFDQSRPNDLSVSSWRPMFEACAAAADTLRPGFSAWVETELSTLEAEWPAGLPAGIIHADLFPDNVFFRDGTVSGIIDLYFACTDFLAYDLAICLNAWCFGTDGIADTDRIQALIDGYESIRPLTGSEKTALPVLARGAALRFLLTRLQDWFLQQDGALTHRKDPLAFVPIIEYHRAAPRHTLSGTEATP